MKSPFSTPVGFGLYFGVGMAVGLLVMSRLLLEADWGTSIGTAATLGLIAGAIAVRRWSPEMASRESSWRDTYFAVALHDPVFVVVAILLVIAIITSAVLELLDRSGLIPAVAGMVGAAVLSFKIAAIRKRELGQ